MGCCKDECGTNCNCPSANVIKGLKAKLLYQSCELKCTPADRCECDEVLDLIKEANEWIDNLEGEVGGCIDG